ncbi:MAG: toll/interleukin-1 receptor domain-containing protein [Syntrophobacterales bacterium]
METSSYHSDSLCTDFPDRSWDTLTYAIHYGNCILLLGPDAVTEEIEGSGIKPCTNILANELAKDIGDDLTKIDTDDLLQSSQYHQWINKDRFGLERQVVSFYEKRKNLTSPLHQNLAQLPFSLIITSTFDNMMLNAMKEEKKQPNVDYHHFRGRRTGIVPSFSAKNPLIYQFFGSLADPNSLVITENDLLEFLVNVASKAAKLPDNIESELRRRNKILLFLGFGFRYWHLRVLLYLINIGAKDSCSFALEKIVPESREEINRTTMFIENKNYNIKICNAELIDFVEKLTTKYKNQYGTTKPDLIAPHEVIEMPKVFISYVRENEKTVMELRNNLRNKQIEPLIDQDFMEVGDDWEQKILETISTVNYFIIMLSQDWIRKGETFAITEVRNAFKRKDKKLEGSKFILPVKIDDKLKIEDLNKIHNKLSDIQAIDLRESTGVDELVQVIRRDFQLRKRDYA